jgi:hypothetical protein
MRRALTTLLIVAVLYSDIASIVNLTNWSLRFPIPQSVFRAFAMFRVFDSWDDENVEFVAEVEVLPLDGSRGGSTRRPFDLYAYFPAPPADARVRISGLFRRDAEGLMSEIQRVYEQSHPGEIVDRVRLYVERWPKSAAGYEVNRDLAARRPIGVL